jgi:Multiubiquitin
METHEHSHQVTIVVNGREKTVPAGALTFEQLVALAFDTMPSGPNVLFTVTYRSAREHGNENHNGSLTTGQSVKPKNGMICNVTATDKS